ncbi:YfcC family protein [Spiroplasma endosymbiont of Aspidapion aeneum]|uniref:YfcC family protein n=1 Tax=Spiroplasma endosymbiont of Aspidapion aeneum TaxID=3066276 RepID=UPI00313C0970
MSHIKNNQFKSGNNKILNNIPSKNDNELTKDRWYHKLRVPSAMLIILMLIGLIVVISWILHYSGVTTSYYDSDSKSSVSVKVKALGIIDIFYEPFVGFQNTSDIIIFMFSIGAFINIVVASKSLEAGTQRILKKMKGREVLAIIPLMLFFSLCGTVEGMCEESLGFYIICVPIMLLIGFDTVTGFLIVFLGAGVGVMCATIDPFAVSTAVKALNSAAPNNHNLFTEGTGLIWRIVSWLVLTSSTITYVMFRALKIRKNPQLSVSFSTLEEDKKFFLSNNIEEIEMTWKRKLNLVIFIGAFIMMIIYIIPWDSILGIDYFANSGKWVNNNLPFITGVIPGFGDGNDNFLIVGSFFLIASIILGFINTLGEEEFLRLFMEGAKGILSVSLIIAMSSGLNQSLSDSNIKWIVIGGVGDTINSIHFVVLKIIVIFILFILISFLLPSTSGFANTVLPLTINSLLISGANGPELSSIAPNIILAFVMANGLVNLFTPLSGVIFGGLELCRLTYKQFWQFMWKIILGLFVLCLIMLIIGTLLVDSNILPKNI